MFGPNLAAAIIMVFLLILSSAFFHPFHVSVTNIYYKESEKVVQVEQRIFLDDFEVALRAFSGNEEFNITNSNKEVIESAVSSYLSEKFVISSKGKPIELQFLGYEIEKETNVIWCYFEAEKVKKFEAFTVTNALLVEIFDDQENIIHYTFPSGKKRSHRTGPEKMIVSFGD